LSKRPSHTPHSVGVIDLGSNTLLLLVMEQGGRVVRELSRITRLGEGVFESGTLLPAARERSAAVVRELAAEARRAGAGRVIGVGTEALRRARDGASFLESLRGGGLLDEARILSGEEEAEYAIEASRRGRGAGESPLVVIDVGGGSTEIAWAVGTDPVRGISLPLGSVRLTERWIRAHPVPETELAALERAARDGVRGLGSEPGAVFGGSAEIVAVAGTATTLAAMELRLEEYDDEAVEGYWISCEALASWIERLSQMSVEQRRALPGLEPGRADVIVAGLVILEQVLGALGAEGFRSSGRGVRHGVALACLSAPASV
jgi:exopolyphosphatase/guanosine-5'-triphosphate,3'-diphosphate pyrophosphatase